MTLAYFALRRIACERDNERAVHVWGALSLHVALGLAPMIRSRSAWQVRATRARPYIALLRSALRVLCPDLR